MPVSPISSQNNYQTNIYLTEERAPIAAVKPVLRAGYDIPRYMEGIRDPRECAQGD